MPEHASAVLRADIMEVDPVRPGVRVWDGHACRRRQGVRLVTLDPRPSRVNPVDGEERVVVDIRSSRTHVPSLHYWSVAFGCGHRHDVGRRCPS